MVELVQTRNATRDEHKQGNIRIEHWTGIHPIDCITSFAVLVRVALSVDVIEKGCLSGRSKPYTHFSTHAHVVIFYITSNLLAHLYTAVSH